MHRACRATDERRRRHGVCARSVPRSVAAGLAVALMLAAGAGHGAESDLENGLRAYETGDFLEAEALLAPLARTGDTTAAYHLGVMYDAGLGVPLDRGRALELFRAAAEAGNGDAAHALGTYYEIGHAVAPDPAQAAHWFRVSAEAGNDKAMANLGNLYDEGLGVERDPVAAARWFERAAEAGNAKAMRRLARLYERGDGVPVDRQRAHELMTRASIVGDLTAKHALALQLLDSGDPGVHARGIALLEEAAMEGYVPAKLKLARIYLYGLGTAIDRSRAYYWLRRCADTGEAWARQRLKALEAGISEEELLRSRQLYSDSMTNSLPSDGEVLAQ